jgi:hypothetical protein
MTTMWEFPIDLKTRQTVNMPERARVLSCQLEGRKICLWALVDSQAPEETRLVYMIGTGHTIPEMPLQFVNTIQAMGSTFHVFVEPR